MGTNIVDKSAEYAAEKVNDLLSTSIMQAYADGYKDGWHDCEKEIPVNLQENRIVFVDLNLPSGTLWSSDYIKDGDDILYCPYEKASKYNIPTEEQCEELFNNCKIVYDYQESGVRFIFVGSNGKEIVFDAKGVLKTNGQIKDVTYVKLWIKDKSNSIEKCVADIYNWNGEIKHFCNGKVFMGFK